MTIAPCARKLVMGQYPPVSTRQVSLPHKLRVTSVCSRHKHTFGRQRERTTLLLLMPEDPCAKCCMKQLLFLLRPQHPAMQTFHLPTSRQSCSTWLKSGERGGISSARYLQRLVEIRRIFSKTSNTYFIHAAHALVSRLARSIC